MKMKTGLVEGGVIVANSGYSFSSLVLPVNARGRRAYRGSRTQQERSIVMAEPEQEDVEEEVEETEEEDEETEQEEDAPESPEEASA